jgi:hypothetical protein
MGAENITHPDFFNYILFGVKAHQKPKAVLCNNCLKKSFDGSQCLFYTLTLKSMPLFLL